MNADFINPFLSSLSNVLATMAMLEVNSGQPSIKKTEAPAGDITGMITMDSPQTSGSLAISFSEAVILEIAERMLQEKFTQINKDIIDLVGELTNMITGGAKVILESKGYDFGMASPVVIQGNEEHTLPVKNGPTIIIPYTIDSGAFYVEICFEKN